MNTIIKMVAITSISLISLNSLAASHGPFLAPTLVGPAPNGNGNVNARLFAGDNILLDSWCKAHGYTQRDPSSVYNL